MLQTLHLQFKVKYFLKLNLSVVPEIGIVGKLFIINANFKVIAAI
jgi:hypothetical protein